MKKLILLLILMHASTFTIIEAGRPAQEDPNSEPERDSVDFIEELEEQMRPKRSRFKPHHHKKAAPVAPAAFATTTSVPPIRKNRKSRRRQSKSSPAVSKVQEDYEREADSGGSDEGNSTLKSTRQSSEASDGIQLQLNPNEQDKDSLNMKRKMRQSKATSFKIHAPGELGDVIGLESEFLFTFAVKTPHDEYASCTSGYPEDCRPGEKCVKAEDFTNFPPATCPPAACTECPSAGQLSQCPVGCRLPVACKPPANGICTDIRKNEEDYVVFEVPPSDPTPMVLYQGTLLYNDQCSAYGDNIDKVQRGRLPFVEKVKIFRTNNNQAVHKFGTEICNWAAAHLECIPDEPRKHIIADAGTPPEPLTPAQINAMKKPKGTCKCMLALGKYAVVLRDPQKDIDICYIPANKGPYSECDQEITPPHGAIDAMTKKKGHVYKGPEPAFKYCVPNAECRTGYKYTGLRCMCKPKTKWDPKLYTCANAALFESCKVVTALMLSIIIILRN